jgi:hypothetical protein
LFHLLRWLIWESLWKHICIRNGHINRNYSLLCQLRRLLTHVGRYNYRINPLILLLRNHLRTLLLLCLLLLLLLILLMLERYRLILFGISLISAILLVRVVLLLLLLLLGIVHLLLLLRRYLLLIRVLNCFGGPWVLIPTLLHLIKIKSLNCLIHHLIISSVIIAIIIVRLRHILFIVSTIILILILSTMKYLLLQLMSISVVAASDRPFFNYGGLAKDFTGQRITYTWFFNET